MGLEIECEECGALCVQDDDGTMTPVEPVARLFWNAEKPTLKGVYAWKGGPAMLALVLVHLRPSAEAPGGVLKGQVLGDGGSKFYDGCAIEQWTGEWIGPLPQ